MTALSFLMWGFLTIYWKSLAHVGPSEVLAHRIIWTLVLLALLLTVQRRWGEIPAGVKTFRDAARVAVCGLCLGGNWYAFVWALANNRVLEASLGYYINPLMSVLLGAVFLGERLGRLQIVALVVTVVAVSNLLVAYGQVPWAGLALAFTFALYGLLRKTSKLDSVPGVLAETCVIAPPAVIFLVYLQQTGRLGWTNIGWTTDLLLLLAGLATTVPLLAFSFGARRIRLSTVGFLQYLAPSCMFLLGVFAYKEPFQPRKLATFLLIWLALGIYSWDSIKAQGRRSP